MWFLIEFKQTTPQNAAVLSVHVFSSLSKSTIGRNGRSDGDDNDVKWRFNEVFEPFSGVRTHQYSYFWSNYAVSWLKCIIPKSWFFWITVDTFHPRTDQGSMDKQFLQILSTKICPKWTVQIKIGYLYRIR